MTNSISEIYELPHKHILEYKLEGLLSENERLTKLINEKFSENHKLLDYVAKVIVLNTDKEKLLLNLINKEKSLGFLSNDMKYVRNQEKNKRHTSKSEKKS